MQGNVFKRYEMKYLISEAQAFLIADAARLHMEPDPHGISKITNIYYDTDSYLLIRRSIESPEFKEKLRIRAYGEPLPGTTVYAELKNKYEGIVYKRRVPIDSESSLKLPLGDGQIDREIRYRFHLYPPLSPKAFICYEREAYFAEGEELRLTFDRHIRYRTENISLFETGEENSLLSSDCVIMEIKASYAIPLWLTAILSHEKIYKTPFSKYGSVYKQGILTGD